MRLSRKPLASVLDRSRRRTSGDSDPLQGHSALKSCLSFVVLFQDAPVEEAIGICARSKQNADFRRQSSSGRLK
eukprot:s9972_g3.t1